MVTSKQSNHSKTLRHNSRSLIDLNQSVSNFIKSTQAGNDPEQELALARKIGQFSGAEAKLKSARALADVAVRHSASFGSETAMHFSEALEISSEVIRLDQVGVYALMARRLQRQAALNFSIAEGRLPKRELLEKTHQRGISGIADTFTTWNKINKRSEASNALRGYMSEEATNLLLERYALTKDGEPWVPMFSLFSDYYGSHGINGSKSGWDISIFTDDPNVNITQPTHKLQVRSRPVKSGEDYDESCGIDLVHVSELVIGEDKEDVLPQYILNELQGESTGKRNQAQRLDARTKVLLDIFI